MLFVSSLSSACLAVFLCIALVSADQADVSLCSASDWWNSTTVPYSFNNNAWGNDSSGYQCLDVQNGGASFTVTYKWTGDASVVKGYPYMKADPSNLPVQLWNVSRLELAGNWTTYVTSTQNDSSLEQAQAFDSTALKVNVAVDMFLSDNITNSTGLAAPIEIMIWPWWIPSVKPLGWAESTPQVDTVAVDGTNFSLYHGYNDGGQHVFSWLAQKNLTSTNADYSPLLKYIWQKGLLSGALWLGQLEFGTEILHAAEETRFEARDYTLRIVRQGDADDVTTTSTSSTSRGTATSTASATTTSVSLPETVSASATPTTTKTSSGAQLPIKAWLLASFVVSSCLYVVG